MIGGGFEVAMGLETAHPIVLERLNKGMSLEQFSSAAERLKQRRIDLRVFVLIHPPYMDEDEAPHWANRSIDFAFDCGASVVTLIPTRPGNGALDALASNGDFSKPTLKALESAQAYGIELRRGRVFADTWDLVQLSECSECFDAREKRLAEINLGQQNLPIVDCGRCEGGL